MYTPPIYASLYLQYVMVIVSHDALHNCISQKIEEEKKTETI
jgi:hypothetical protein